MQGLFQRFPKSEQNPENISRLISVQLLMNRSVQLPADHEHRFQLSGQLQADVLQPLPGAVKNGQRVLRLRLIP